MKMNGMVLCACWALGQLLMSLPPAQAQAAAGVEGEGAALHAQQLTAERAALQAMLDDANTPAEKRALIQQLLEWNTRGMTIGEFKQRQALMAPSAPPAVAATTPPPNNLAEAEAAPLPANVNVGSGALLQNFSKGRDAEAAARSSASLGLVKTQQEMENATRESEAKLREAQQVRNAAGASALAQRQQDAASAASQQAAGGLGAVMGESLVQSVQQGAQAAGQAIGGGAAGRMSGVAGSASGAGGAIGGGAGDAVGASTAAGQIFGGGASAAPAAVGSGQGGGAEPVANPVPATIGFEASAMGEGSAKRAVGKRLDGPEPWQRVQGAGPESASGTRRAQTIRRDEYPTGHRNVAGAGASAGGVAARPAADRIVAGSGAAGALRTSGAAAGRVRGLFDAVCPKHGKYGGDISRGTACPRCEQEKYMMWDAVCPSHGAYGGQGPITGCPKCKKWIIRDAK